MYGFLIFLFVIVALLMTLTILMQSSKGGGLASSFGGLGGGGVLGPRGAASFLQKATTILATTYILLCLIIGFIGRPSAGESGSVLQRELQRQQEQMSTSPIPVAPPTDVEPLPAPDEAQEQPDENPE